MIMLFLAGLLLLAQADYPDILGDGSDTQPDVLYYIARNFSPEGVFRLNLDAVVSRLIREKGNLLTYNEGKEPDEAFGYSKCFYKTVDCGSCLLKVMNTIRKDQRYNTAFGARYWLNRNDTFSCYLRYENYPFIFTVSPAPTPALPPVKFMPILISASNSKAGLYAGIGAGVCGFVILCVGVSYFLIWRPRHRKYYTKTTFKFRTNEPTVFQYDTLRAVTNNFDVHNEIGMGGFGTVYKGVLDDADGTKVAVKKLSLQSHQGQNEFINEIRIITGIQHRNLVRLKGYCAEGDQKLLVYEFLASGSLDSILFSDRGTYLSWKNRHDILIGVARGLAYLHEESHIRIIHRDIKASNILLDENLNPKISDFGISKHFEQHFHLDDAQTSSVVAGTLGYLAPEYATCGRLTSKVDVFSFGVLALEIVTGRRCNDRSLPQEQQILLAWAWSLFQSKKLAELVDKRLSKESFAAEEVERVVHIALMCTQEDEELRPVMSDVVALFQGYKALTPISPGYFLQDRQLPELDVSSDSSNSKISKSLIVFESILLPR